MNKTQVFQLIILHGKMIEYCKNNDCIKCQYQDICNRYFNMPPSDFDDITNHKVKMK